MSGNAAHKVQEYEERTPTGTVTLGTDTCQDANARFVGHVKFFDPVRRWGFLLPDDGSEDVHISWLTLQRWGVPEGDMMQGAPVEFQVKPPKREGHKREATFVKILK